MEEQNNILLSELVKPAGYSVDRIRIIAKGYAFVAAARLIRKDESCTVFIYPLFLAQADAALPSGVFTDAVLSMRVCSSTESVYYSWKELLSGTSSFSVSGDYFIPVEPFGGVLSYPSAVINGGLVYSSNERSSLITTTLISDK